ncbi:Protein of unassigned function [Methylorubrum populi]
MRKFAVLLSIALAAMAAILKAVFEGGRWVIRSLFGPPTPTGLHIEEAMDAVQAAAAPMPASDTVRAVDTVQPADTVRAASLAEAAAAMRDWGRVARLYAVSRFSSEPEPDMTSLDESAEGWLRGLSNEECGRLLDFGAQRVSDHMLGQHPIPGLPRCLQRPAWAPAVLLADIEGDERVEAVRADLARDPASVPGYRVAA